MTPGFFDDACEGAEFDEVRADLRPPYRRLTTSPRDAARFEEIHRQRRIEAGIEDACRVCGCSESRPCEGGCVWVEVDLCSRCYRAIQAMGKAFSAGGSDV
jgi:hypothetical protein